jgi:hypothetical protein
MRASTALEPKSHVDSKTPITGDVDSRVAVWEPVVCRRRKRSRATLSRMCGQEIKRRAYASTKN